MPKPILTVIISTFNEEKNIIGVIDSVEKNIKTPYLIKVWDTGSTDKTTVLAKQVGAKVISHPPVKVVEEIRQKSIDEAQTEWILIIDADERLTPVLGRNIDEVIKKNKFDIIGIPRLNYFFGQPLKYAGWWPDYQARLFKKDSLTWPIKIHTRPAPKKNATYTKLSLDDYLIHHNYLSISDFIQRLNRYTDIEARQLVKSKTITVNDLLNQPCQEFFRRYFSYQGYKGGVLGFSASLLMTFYVFVAYLKAYHFQKQSWQDSSPLENPQVTKKLLHDYFYWRSQTRPQSVFQKLITKLKLFFLG